MRRTIFADERGAAGVFSVLTLLVLSLCIAYTAGMADATLEKMKMQDAADAAAYSGARVRGNLYAMMGFFNQAKLVLYRRKLGYKMTDGQAAILMEMARITGVNADPVLLSDDVLALGEEVGEKATAYARLADNFQQYIEENFVDVITSEIKYVAQQHECELLASAPGGAPVFRLEDDPFRYWMHFLVLGKWTGYEVWDCDIVRGVVDPDVEDENPPPYPMNEIPAPPWTPRYIGHAMTHERNSIKSLVQETAHESMVLPGVLKSFHPEVVGTGAAGCFSPTLNDPAGNYYENLYTTDFRAQMLSLGSAQFREWLNRDEPALAQEIPWVWELTVH